MSRGSFNLPTVRANIKDIRGPLWDIKFYPYVVDKEDWVIFAACGHWDILCCRLNDDVDEAIEVLATWSRDPVQQDNKHTINSCTWCYVDQSKPLLAVTGENGQIEVIDPLTGQRHYLLGGHGLGVINDLATHPKFPWIIASCSIDQSIRVWDLRRADEPHLSSTIILCGQNHAHKEGIISISWHHTGRYIVSGGFDQRVCVWTMPDLDQESTFWQDLKDRKRSSEEVHIIYYPHFISSAIHSEYVDAVMFYGDFVISKACREDKILLWSITGFNSENPPPAPSQAPKSLHHLETRNGFLRKPKVLIEDDVLDGAITDMAPFTRLIEFSNDKSESFYMRFGLLQPSQAFPDLHTVLSVGDNICRLKHWDLDRYLGSDKSSDKFSPIKTIPPIKKRDLSRGIAKPIGRKTVSISRSPSVVTMKPPSDGRESSAAATSVSEQDIPEEGKLDWAPGSEPLKPHVQNNCAQHIESFTIRGVGWSSCGQWCVAAGETTSTSGSHGAMLVLDRRRGRNPGSSNHDLPDKKL